MARSTEKRITGIAPSTVALFQGAFGALVGFAVAILRSLDTTVVYADQTDSVLRGLTFGVATGIVAIIVIPLAYFGIFWVIGYFQGFVINAVLKTSGGLVVEVED